MILLKIPQSITLSLLSDGDMIKPQINNIGLSETHGENIGEKWDISESPLEATF